jgi:phosphopantothenoylcysteine decarboxylase/phosphopantothenate--cysteine ligase
MAQLAHGEAHDLLTTLCVASKSPLAIAPAMNQAMWSNTATEQNLQTLKHNGIHIFGPDAGEQACGDIGLGRMQEPHQLVAQAAALFATGALAGLAVVITAGPTREAVDPVRFISNHSSGKMGYALARAAVEAGATVTLVSGPTHLPPPAGVTFIAVENALQMLAACEARTADIFIGVAAVADYRPAQAAQQKIKKSAETLSLELVPNPDILATIAASNPRPFCVGFAAETENLVRNAEQKLRNKKLDMIIANDAEATFGHDHAGAIALWTGGEETFARQSKEQLARRIIDLIAVRIQSTR